jgi:phospholipase/lecithinase/hemolysin
MNMKTSRLLSMAAALLAGAAVSLPASAQVDFTRLVVVGDSEGAGFADGCLAKHSQIDSFGAILARQAGADFQQPLLDEPGIGGCYVLTSLVPLVLGPGKPNVLKPLNLNLPRPYNNLAVGGCTMRDLTNATTAANATPGTCQNTIDLVLRNSALNIGSQVDQALALNPTFIFVEMVGNDYLGAVTAGDIRDGVTITPVSVYTAAVNAALTKLKTKVANGIIFTSADVTNIPFSTALPPFFTNNGVLVLVNGAPIPLLGPKSTADPTKPCTAPKGGCPIPATTIVTLNAAGYMPSGAGIPCAVVPTLPLCDFPLPDAPTAAGSPFGAGKPGAIIYANNVALLKQRAVDYNAAITTAAAAVGYKVYDTNSFLTRLKTGFDFGGVTISAAFLTGGAISYDGFHLSSIGQAILADDLTQFINTNFNAALVRPNLVPYIFNGNSTGGIPPAAFYGPDPLGRVTAAIFNPDMQNYLFNFIRPKPAALGDTPVGDSPPVRPSRNPIDPGQGN